MVMAGSRSSLGAVIGAIACFLCIGLLVSIAIESSSVTTTAMPPMGHQGMSSSSSSSLRSRPNAKMNLDPLYKTLKRRVPNGPDPIHNRREGKSGRPPGRA